MTYEEAVAYVLREKGAAYTFLPKNRGIKTIGGAVYAIAYDKDHETEPDEYYEYNVYYNGGLFQSSSGEGEIYGPEEVPEEAKSAAYQITDPEVVHMLSEAELDFFLLRLQGKTAEEANAELDARPR